MREFVQGVQDATSGNTAEALVRIMAKAAGAYGGLLWAGPAGGLLSLLAFSIDGVPSFGLIPEPDPVTTRAFESNSYTLPGNSVPPQYGGHSVWAAFPLRFVDGTPGVFTLLGKGHLGHGLDAFTDLLGVLPDLYQVLQERQALALVHRCNAILHRADVEAAGHALALDRVKNYFDEIAATIAETLGCQDVRILLCSDGTDVQSSRVFASSSGQVADWPRSATEALLASVLADNEPQIGIAVGHPLGPLMATPLETGDLVWGAIVCAGRRSAPTPFTPTDLSLLRPLASQVAQYWTTWQARRIISEENEAWRRLAAGITTFNRLLSEQLRKRTSSDAVVYEEASRILRAVITDLVGCGLRGTDAFAAPLPERWTTWSVERDADAPRCRDGGPVGDKTLRTQRQQVTSDSAVIAGEGLRAPVRWLVSTPVRVGDKPFGVLDVFGSAKELAPYSSQVAEIVADQLGLYKHLERTMSQLRETRKALEAASRIQAETLEDLEHQLISPLITATNRTEAVIRSGRFDGRTELELKKVRGLCRRAYRVATSAGVFATLRKGQAPTVKMDLLGVDELLRVLIASADDAQTLANPKRSIRFTVDRESVRTLNRSLLLVDQSFVEQCVGNLLDNASKYGYSGTEVHIRGVRSARFSIGVSSTGIRLEPKDAERCLHRDWRGAVARQYAGEGSGLGLFIVWQLMQCMNGDVKVEPDGDMTTVLLTFPIV